MTKTTAVSSPGKVLAAGGYLVLDAKYPGIVISTSSRFYTVVSQADPSRAADPIQVRVRSPQFVDATWIYAVHVEESTVRVEQVADISSGATGKNKFVQLALDRVFLLALETKGAAALREVLSTGLDVLIVGDNDFYSQRAQLASRNLKPTLQSLSQLPPFLHTGVRLSEVHKTGLGSSAALITSLVSSLLLHLGVIPADSFEIDTARRIAGEGKLLAHNVAQYVHCLAQGKVGSGFDVSSAVFGSQIYTRFDPKVLQHLMDDSAAPAQSLTQTLSISNEAWSYKVEPFKLPPMTRIMLADVDAGSDTPSLVGKVLKWRKENSAESTVLWDALNESNQSLGKILSKLSDLHAKDPREYSATVELLSGVQSAQWSQFGKAGERLPIAEEFAAVFAASEDIRAKMRKMGTLSGVPIEPPEQTELLDACMSVAGVFAGGVPGAGGYDAIWLLVLEPQNSQPSALPSSRVEALWQSWTRLEVSPLSASESFERGARIEKVDSIPGLKELL